jgi:hypothetical protein
MSDDDAKPEPEDEVEDEEAGDVLDEDTEPQENGDNNGVEMIDSSDVDPATLHKEKLTTKYRALLASS